MDDEQQVAGRGGERFEDAGNRRYGARLTADQSREQARVAVRVLVAIVLAIPLALRFGKRGRMLGVGLAIIAFVVYYLLTSAVAAFGRNGAIDPYVAAWIPNVLMGRPATFLFWMEER